MLLLIASIVLTLLALWLIDKGVDKQVDKAEAACREGRTVHTSAAIHLPRATISYDLGPLIDQLTLNGATITIVGSDGSYLTDRSDQECKARSDNFEKCIRQWIKARARIRYILIDPDDSARNYFRELGLRLGDSFEVFVPSNTESHDPQFAGIIKRFTTLHPTLIELGEGQRAFWVEYDHPAGSPVAFATKFVSPRAYASSDSEREEFDIYERQLGLLEPHLEQIDKVV